MADLQEQLQAILGDPEAMGQITAIARALTGGGGEEPPSGSAGEASQGDFLPVEDTPPSDLFPGGQPPDLSGLLSSVGGLGDIDPRLIQIALRLYSEYNTQDDDKAALLAALKPFLKPERQEKMEKAIRVARLSGVVRVAVALLKEEGGKDHV